MAATTVLGATMQVLQPAAGVLAFYDGRIPGVRAFSREPNWVDDGAFELGIASYAVLSGEEALVYDPHISVVHARIIRKTLEARGVRRMRVVLSHWHLDHIAGTEVFADCEVIAHVWTDAEMRRRKAAIEAGTADGAPPIKPLILPTRTYEDELALDVGGRRVELRHADIHSRDETLLLLPDARLLLAGDTLEDTVTFVAEPEGLERHLDDLARVATWDVNRILPNHGAPDIIANGGYQTSFIAATERYVERLLRSRNDEALQKLDLKAFVADELAAGWITYFEPYENVHRGNVEAACGRSSPYCGSPVGA